VGLLPWPLHFAPCVYTALRLPAFQQPSAATTVHCCATVASITSICHHCVAVCKGGITVRASRYMSCGAWKQDAEDTATSGLVRSQHVHHTKQWKARSVFISTHHIFWHNADSPHTCQHTYNAVQFWAACTYARSRGDECVTAG